MSQKSESTPPPEEHWHEILDKEFVGESDRACVIVAAALLDIGLRNLLLSWMVPNPTSSDPVFSGANAPLSTFSSRIDMSHRLGLLSPRFCRDLHLVRKIRNEFAHNISGCGFDESSVRDRILALSTSCYFDKAGDAWRNLYPDTSKGRFQFSVAWMQWCIRSFAMEVKPLEPAELEWGYKGKWADLGTLPEDVSPIVSNIEGDNHECDA